MDEILQRADRYAKERTLIFTKELGAGIHGIVRVATLEREPNVPRVMRIHFAALAIPKCTCACR